MGTIPYVPSYLRASPSLIWPVTSVLDFGAIGNGSTDDYPAITAALHALNARGGGTLVFPNDRDFRIATPGVHGIHLERQSNITIVMGERSRLIMDNMVGGLAVSHGIFVEGPCENISLIGVHVKFAALSASRQTWAPIYFLGANVGNGDASLAPALGWYRGNPDGSEAWQQIEAGAVRNVRLENVTSENSPSVGIGIVGVDGLRGYNITLRETWADGLYHLYFRNSRIDGYYGINVGDDGLSTASYESDLEGADIELPFHGEGSTFSNIVLEGRHGDAPAGSIVPLGVRDVRFSNIVVTGRFRGIKLEPGTQLTQDYPTLSLNFLANRRVTIDDMSMHGGEQGISLFVKECNFAVPDKWWRHDMIISNFIGEDGVSCFDIFGFGIPRNGGPNLPLTAGITFKNIKFRNYTNPNTTLAGLVDCVFDGIEIDSFVSIHGFVPYGSNPDLLDGDGNPMWPENFCTFSDFRCKTLLFQGLKRCSLNGIESVNSPERGITLTSCADLQIDDIRIVYPNRINDPLNNAAYYQDEYCKRISGSGFHIETDDHFVTAVGLLNAESHWISDVRVKTTQNLGDQNVTLTSDRGWIDNRVSQIGRVEVHHSGNDKGWIVRQFPLPPPPTLHGDADADLFVSNQNRHHRLTVPLTADRTWILHEDVAAIGDRIEISREATSTGASVIIQGQSQPVDSFPVSDAQTTATVAGGAGSQLASLLVGAGTALEMELLAAPVAWAGSDAAMAEAIADAINANTGVSDFTASSYDKQFVVYAPAGSGLDYNNVTVDQAASGELSLSVGHIPRFKGGSDAASAGESTASTEFLLVDDFFPGFAGTIASITVNGTELLAEPVEWLLNSNQTAVRVGQAILDNIDAHGFFANASKNAVFIEAPKGNGASANGWVVVVTTTGDVETYDVHAMSGGVDPRVETPAGTPYDIVTPVAGTPFHAVFEFTGADGWKLVFMVQDDGSGGPPTYPSGADLFNPSTGTLMGPSGQDIVDPSGNLLYPGYAQALTDGLFIYNVNGETLVDENGRLVYPVIDEPLLDENYLYAPDGRAIADVDGSLLYTNVLGRKLTDDNTLYAPNGEPLVGIDGVLMYPNGAGVPLAEGGTLYAPNGTALATAGDGVLYSNGQVLGHVDGTLAMGLSNPPTATGDPGSPGMITWDANHLYVCTAPNTWKRVALATF